MHVELAQLSGLSHSSTALTPPSPPRCHLPDQRQSNCVLQEGLDQSARPHTAPAGTWPGGAQARLCGGGRQAGGRQRSHRCMGPSWQPRTGTVFFDIACQGSPAALLQQLTGGAPVCGQRHACSPHTARPAPSTGVPASADASRCCRLGGTARRLRSRWTALTGDGAAGQPRRTWPALRGPRPGWRGPWTRS